MPTTVEPAERPPLETGQELLDGRLVIRGVLGRGAMGVVYRADDRRLDRQVALKTLVTFDADGLYQLKRSFRTLAGFSHRNLVQLYELGAAGSLWFLIMELVEGVDLAGWLQSRPPRSRVLHVFGDVAEALRVLHAAGLMHRDVKPANVMVTPDDQAVLLDFGLTAPVRASGVTLTAGTLDYMAPEQLWNESPDARADWYSFGVMLFEALTGTLPFGGPDHLKAMRRGLQAGPRAFAPDLPAQLDDLVIRLLSPDRERRPDAAEIARLIERPVSPVVSIPDPEAVPFVGRTGELDALRRGLRDVRDGGARLLHLHGPSGIGKTALVRHFLARARTPDDVLVLEGQCHPRESVPYNALDGVVDHLARHLLSLEHRNVLTLAPRHAAALVHLFPVLGRVPAVREWPIGPLDLSPSDVRRRGGEALRELLVRLGDLHPIVVWVDDVQWSDRDSGVLLQSLLAPPEPPRMLLLLTSREDEGAQTLLAAVSAVVPRTDVAIGPLTEPESRELARALAPAGAGSELETLAADASGSPFLLAELARHLRHGTAAVEPFTMSHALRSRFRQLEPGSRRLLDAVAIAGKPVEIDLALDVAQLGPGDRLLAWSLCSSSLLRMTAHDGRQLIETYHDRLREFAIDDMGPDEARAWHRRLAGAILASRAPDLRAVVGHLLAAGEGRRAASFAVPAAQEAAHDLAFDQAVEMYDVALAHGPDARDSTLLERRADMLAHAGRRAEAAVAYEAAAASTGRPRDARAALRVQAAEQFFQGGELKRGLAVLESVLGDVGIRVPRSTRGRMLKGMWYRLRFMARGSALHRRDPAAIARPLSMRLDALWRTARGIVMLDPVLADVLAGEHLLESLRCGDASRASRALGLEAAIEANLGGRWLQRRSARLLDEADRIAARHGTAYDRAWLAQARTVCAFFEGRWRDSLALGQRAEELHRASEAGASWDVAALQGFMLSALANLGELPELARRVDALLRDAERRRDQYVLRAFRTGDAVLIWLAADSVERALRLARDTLVDYDAGQFTSQHRHYMVAAVQAYLYAGQPAPAWDEVERAWPLLRRSGFLLMDCLGTQLRYLRACTAVAMARQASARERGPFLRAARHEAKRIARSAQPMAGPMARAVLANIAGVEDRRDAQRQALAAAIDGFARADMALHRAAACWCAADLGLAPEKDGAVAAAWMTQHGVLRPELMARALIPAG
ncbi:MAG TPA: protein kinase [Vicinamibacterales bacterium]